MPVILSTDKTQLTTFAGKHSCYPVYLTIGNISKQARRSPSTRAHRLVGYLPSGKLDKTLSKAAARRVRSALFHMSMRIICQSLFEPAQNGVHFADSHGCVRSCHPILAAYVADYPEQCLVTCIRYGQTCPVCDCSKDDFDMDDFGDPRDQEDTYEIISIAMHAPTKADGSGILQEAGLNNVAEPFWLGWTHANVHAAITSDVLHQIVQGVGKHVVQWLIALAPANELDARIQRLPKTHGLRRFKEGISDLANISGSEHKAIYSQIIGCVHGIVPNRAVKAATALLDFLYIAQYESHSTETLDDLRMALSAFHEHKSVFIEEEVRTGE